MIYGVAILLIGLLLVVLSSRLAARVNRRIAEGDDRFFEEQRTYRAYPSLSNPASIRWKGVAIAIGGMALILIELLRS